MSNVALYFKASSSACIILSCSEQSQNVALESDAPEMKITEHIIALLIMYLKL